MIRFRSLFFVVALATTLMTSAGAAPPLGAGSETQQLIGQWRLQNSPKPLRIEFGADGTYRADSPYGVLTGRWGVLPGGRLATWVREDRPKRVNKYAVTKDWLVIVNEDGTFLRHRRME